MKKISLIKKRPLHSAAANIKIGANQRAKNKRGHKMREMIYKPTPDIEILSSGTFEGYKYFIISLGTHPCRYVETQANRVRFINVNTIWVHGGITYTGKELPTIGARAENGIFIGWDYRHRFDYMGFMEDRPAGVFNSCKKWTTAEILEDVKDVIKQLLDIERENK